MSAETNAEKTDRLIRSALKALEELGDHAATVPDGAVLYKTRKLYWEVSAMAFLFAKEVP